MRLSSTWPLVILSAGLLGITFLNDSLAGIMLIGFIPLFELIRSWKSKVELPRFSHMVLSFAGILSALAMPGRSMDV